jgi:large subunit ribosomal protein L3
MRETILAKKLGMSQIFDHQGNAIPVTLVQAGPCTVLQIKTKNTDGYNSIQLGFGEKKEKHTTKPLKGHFAKSDSTPKRHIRESRVEDTSRYEVGMTLTAGIFQKGDQIDVTGISKGKGFAGVMKRYGFSGFPATHGTHENFRGPGSIGSSADPARVFKGKKMPGQMGDETVTVQNMKIVDIREEQNLMIIKGPLPGGKNGLLVISHAIKKTAPEPRELVAPEPEPEDEVLETVNGEPVESASGEPVETAVEETPEPVEDETVESDDGEPAESTDSEPVESTDGEPVESTEDKKED